MAPDLLFTFTAGVPIHTWDYFPNTTTIWLIP
jgi:hypothetical protein